MIIIEHVDNTILSNCNTNNHPIKETDDIDPTAYHHELSKTYLSKYADLINYPCEYTYEFTKEEVLDLIQMCEISTQTQKQPKLYQDDYDKIIKRFSDHFVEGHWFFRFDSCSPKDGSIEFPAMSSTDVIQSIVTSIRAYKALRKGENKLYFCRFDSSWDQQKELRIFVKNNKVTCISPYIYYSTSFWSTLSNDELTDVASKISNKVTELSAKFNVPDYVADMYYQSDGQLKIIELNSFGYWLASGSALFHWLNDYDKLYGSDGNIYFRVLNVENVGNYL